MFRQIAAVVWLWRLRAQEAEVSDVRGRSLSLSCWRKLTICRGNRAATHNPVQSRGLDQLCTQSEEAQDVFQHNKQPQSHSFIHWWINDWLIDSEPFIDSTLNPGQTSHEEHVRKIHKCELNAVFLSSHRSSSSTNVSHFSFLAEGLQAERHVGAVSCVFCV